MTNQAIKWRFFRSGGFDQPSIDTGAQLLNLSELNHKLWVALACPTDGLHFDKTTLTLVDTDKDGRIRAPELLAALKWTGSLIKNPDELLKSPKSLPLASIDTSTPAGAQVHSSAKRILANLGKTDAAAITPADASNVAAIFANTAFNGDGVITPASTSDDSLKAIIAEAAATCGGAPDRSGATGINAATIEAFFASLASFVAWKALPETDKTILPLGPDGTPAAAAAIDAVKAKVEDYFARCRLAAFDARATSALNLGENAFLALAAKDLADSTAEIAALPLARVEPGRPLPLADSVNPAWAAAVETLAAKAIAPVLGERKTLSEAEWKQLNAALAPYRAWVAAKAGANVESLGADRAKTLLASDAPAKLKALVESDLAEASNAAAIDQVHQLVAYYCNLYELVRNFVNFRDFYDPSQTAIFIAGTLYLDQRSCDLCLPVADAAKHASMAGLAGAYLAYCDLVRKGTGEKRQIVAAFTNGDSDNLMVGRNGLFFDRDGKDWDATITRIVDNPISIRQAFWSPYKKLVRFIDEQIAKRAAAADSASTAKLQGAATTATTVDPKAPPAPPKKIDVGSVAAIGIAFGAIGTFLATLAAYAVGILQLGPLAIIGALAGVLLLISGPSMLIAYLKLRKRNLGPILDANGWAVNALAKITVPFGAALTGVPKLPAGSTRDIRDPFAEKKSPWPYLIVAAIILWLAYNQLDKRGYIHDWTNGALGAPAPIEAPATVETTAPEAPAPTP